MGEATRGGSVKYRVKNTHVNKDYGVFESRDAWARSIGYADFVQFLCDPALQNKGRHIVFETVEEGKRDP